MAGKITELAVLSAPAPDDLVEVVDISDTSMAATGTNKRMALSLVATGPAGPAGPQGDWSAPQTINTQTGMTYELALTDAGKLVLVNNTGAQGWVDLYIPTNATAAFPVGARVDLLQGNTAYIRVSGRAGVTLRATPSTRTRAQWSIAGVLKIGTDEWVLMGDLYPV